MAKKRIPADIFDALEFSALAFGGIGAGLYNEYVFDADGERVPVAPYCIVGHTAAICGSTLTVSPTVYDRLQPSERDNDAAVRRINKRLGRKLNTRVRWEEYVQEVGWERAES